MMVWASATSDVLAPNPGRSRYGERAAALGGDLSIILLREKAPSCGCGYRIAMAERNQTYWSRRRERKFRSYLRMIITCSDTLAKLLRRPIWIRRSSQRRSTGLEANSELTKQLASDVAIVDIAMKELNGIETTSQILRHSPETAVLILSM